MSEQSPTQPAPSWDSPRSPDLGKFWTAPNMLSLLRVVLAVPIMYLVLVDGSLLWLLVLFLLAIASDYFDGFLARWLGSVSDWGKVLDPLADKIGGSLVILGLVIRGSLPVWLLLLIIVRDVLIVMGGIFLGRRTGLVVMSLWSGKVAVTTIAITAIAALLHADPPVMQFCIWTTTVVLLYSFVRYIGRFVSLRRAGRLSTTMASQDEAGSATIAGDIV